MNRDKAELFLITRGTFPLQYAKKVFSDKITNAEIPTN